MASKPEERRAHWKREHPDLKNWKTIASNLTYSEALKRETTHAAKNGYEAHPGGRKKPGRVYSVYKFNY